MAIPLLETKLTMPPVRPGLVPRPRANRLLNEGLSRKVALVCAPAGFGKTMLVRAWLRDLQIAHVWLSLDENDNDPARFFAYLVGALQRIEPSMGQAAQAMLQVPQPPALEVVLTSLINDIAADPTSFVLVIDDYHVIHNRIIQQLVAALVDYQPSHMHLVLATREEPALPLARMRARAQVADIREADLRFSGEETALFLRKATALDLAPEYISALHARTEGWIAGLQLAALSLRGSQDVRGFVQSFTGSNRYILDYLMDEVFEQQPAELCDFLLKTSILDRFNDALCDAVVGRPESSDVLRRLEDAHLFLISLDESREWFRYHRLFADLLRHRLEMNEAIDVDQLHRRAGRWLADNGHADQAVGHALDAGAWEDAVAWIMCVSDQLLRRGEGATLLDWFRRLPVGLVRGDPQLCLEYCWSLILTERIDEAETYLTLVRETAAAREDRLLSGELAMAEAYVARTRGDGALAIERSVQALSLLPPEDTAARSVVTINLGVAQWFRGDLMGAEEALREAERAGEASANEYARWMASVFLRRIECARGRLHAAARGCRRIICEAKQPSILCLARYDLARLCYEWNDLAAAVTHLEAGVGLAHRSGLVEFEGGGCSILGWVKQMQGETAAAQDALRMAEPLLSQPGVQPATRTYNLAHQVLVALATGEVDRAACVARGFPRDPQEAGSFPDFLLVLLARARLLLTLGRREAAATALAQAYAMAGQAGWRSLAIQSRALQAVAAPSVAESMAYLGEALALAEPEGYVRTFVDAGEGMAPVLREARSRDIAAGYTRTLLAAFGTPVAAVEEGASTRPVSLIEPLSERETEVLGLLASGLTYREIAQTLVLSINTVKTHVRNVYGKLGVRRRRAAVTRARQLGLLP